MAAIVVVMLTSKFCYAKIVNPFDADAFQLQMDTNPDENSLRNNTSDTTSNSYSSKTYYDTIPQRPWLSIFKLGLGMAYSTNDFVVITGDIEFGFPNIFDGLSFSFGLGEGFIASDTSQELGFFFCVTMMAKYTLNIDEFYFPGVGLKFLGGGTINFVGDSKEYETLGLMGYIRLPFLAVLLLDTSVTLELITDSTPSVGLCFDMMLGLHF